MLESVKNGNKTNANERMSGFDMGIVVTIDGPAASGKSSVSRELAARLGWSWVSTGAFYRGLAYVAHVLKMDLNNEAGLAALAASDRWEVRMTEPQTEVYFESRNVTDLLNAEEVGNLASKISHYPSVRKSLLGAQRRCQNDVKGLVAEGRDCGTVVFPQAPVKIYLTARSESRAERRAKELGLSAEATHEAQSQRDHQDTTRKAAPLQIPENAVVVDTSELNLAQVVDLVETHVRATLPASLFV